MPFPSLFRRAVPSVARVPEGYRVYAIGDVHGRDDLLENLLGEIDRDIAARGPVRNFLIFLGDLIDRGPASAGVIDRLIAYEREGVTPVFLAGNHEEVLQRIISGHHDLISSWLSFGGAAFLQSYGVDPSMVRRMDPAKAVEIVRTAVPQEHVRFLDAMGDTFKIGDYLFVHAGIRPGLPLADQSQADLRWIRGPFLNHSGSHGFVVVHGHTISEEIDARDNRIGIDTGAHATGVLTAFGAEGEERWFLQTRPPAPTAAVADR